MLLPPSGGVKQRFYVPWALDRLYGWARRSAHYSPRRRCTWRYERACDGMVHRLEDA